MVPANIFDALPTEVLGELLCIQRGAHEDDFEVIPEAEQVLDYDEQHIRLQVSLVNFVQHKVTDAGQEPAVRAPKTVHFSSAGVMNLQFDVTRLEYCISLNADVTFRGPVSPSFERAWTTLWGTEMTA